MKQVENYKCTSKYVPHTYLDTRDSPDSCWKHPQKNQTFTVNRNGKVLSSTGMFLRNPESVTNSYSSSMSCKPQRSHVCPSPTYSKYTSHHGPEASHLQCHSKPTRNKQHYSSNFSSMRKTHYDDELENVEKFKFINEKLGNLTEENAQEEVEEEVTEDDREEADECLQRYEEEEADDEIDDESDAPLQTHRPQRGSKNETLVKQQRWRTMEQPDARRLRCQQRVAIVQNHHSSPRYYHNVTEHEVPEPLSEEDFVRTSLKSPTRRKPTEYRQWSSLRNEPDRYDDVTPSIQTIRRARTKPDVDHLIESELTRSRRCNRCGSLSNKRNEPTARSGCRFDNPVNIPTKGPIGDEPNSHEQAFCGRCNLRYSTKGTSDVIDIPSPLYATKSRRSRDVKSPTIYEVPDQGPDKLSTDYTRSSTRYQRKDTFPEKSKRSLHTSHATARIPSRYLE